MKRRESSLAIVPLLIISSFCFSVMIIPGGARATVHFVGGSGPANFTTIQAAVDYAFPGDTIFVYNGTYAENVIVNKTLTLVGERRDITIVNGGYSGNTILVTADWVNVTGLSVTRGGGISETAGIKLDQVENCSVADVNLTDSLHGVYLENSNNNVVINSSFDSIGSEAIYLWRSKQNHVGGHILLNNALGIVSTFWSDYNSILNSQITNSRIGIMVELSESNVLANNTLTNSGVYVNGYELADWNTHTIDTSNTVNGKPVYYWKDKTSGKIPEDAAEAIIANCSYILVENLFVANGSGGIQMGFSHKGTVANNEGGVMLVYSDNITVVNNTIPNTYAIYLSNSNHNFVANNTADVMTGGMTLDISSDNEFINNTFSGSSVYGVYALGSDRNTFVGNRFLNNGEGAYFDSSSDNIFGENVFGSNSQVGIHLQNVCNRNIFTHNDFVANRKGLRIDYYTEGNIITNNSFTSSLESGVYIEDATNNTVEMNEFHDNKHGVHVFAATSNKVVGNNITSSAQDGIYVQYSIDTVIQGNSILVNSRSGVFLNWSFNTQVYHNNFINNMQQAIDDNDANQWDDGYPSGGNFWSDYTGVDVMWGPNQDQSGSDGIGDTPRIIDADSQDRYPLMNPVSYKFPRPATVLDGELTGDNLENVTVRWLLSPDDGGGWTTVTGYSIFRNTTYDSRGLGYTLIDAVPNGTSEYVDTLAGEGDPNDYFYQICAVDLYNNTSCALRQAGKFTSPLAEGANLGSVPLIQLDESVSSVLQTVSWDNAWTYDSSVQKWMWSMKVKPYTGQLESVNHTLALWVNVTRASNFTVAGIVPIQTEIHLRAGWNLVGFPSFSTTYTVNDLKSETGATRVEGFDVSSPPYFLRILQDSDALVAGYGYWVCTNQDAIWTLSNM